MSAKPQVPRILIIAGSDSGGGAGIQADIKTVTMLGGFAMTAITAITAQNTMGVTAIHSVPADMVIAQIDAVVQDIGVDAIKIGMIGSASIAGAVADYLQQCERVPLVFDPVMVATSGSVLADPDTIDAFGRLMSLATITTPNLPELAALGEGDDEVAAALHLVSLHGSAVLIKGGHQEGDALVDALIEEDNMTSWQSARIPTRNTHGTGCTLASAIATFLGHGHDLVQAVEQARNFVRLGLHEALDLGEGHGPLHHGAVRLDSGPTLRLNQVTIGLADYDGSVAFYRMLGLRQIVDNGPDYARFEAAGGVTLSLHRNPNSNREMGADCALYLECPDLDDQVERLGRSGVRFDQVPISQPWLWREAWLRDPFGNRLCLYQAGENRRFPPWRMNDKI